MDELEQRMDEFHQTIEKHFQSIHEQLDRLSNKIVMRNKQMEEILNDLDVSCCI